MNIQYVSDSDKIYPVITIINVTCAFCGEHKFHWTNYVLVCANCGARIHFDSDKKLWDYSYPASHIFEPDNKPKGTKWRLGSTSYWSAVPLYDVNTGHKLPDYEQIHKLEMKKNGCKKEISKIDKEIERLRG